MTSYWLAGVAAVVFMTGPVLAQGMSSETTTSTQSSTSAPAPVAGSYDSSKSQKTIDSNGTETDKSQTYTSGVGGTKASSSTQTTTPGGSQLNSYHEEQTAPPSGETTTTTRSTTTTTGQ